MKQAYLDCFSGISGDMFMGALIDIGWPVERFSSIPGRLGLMDTSIKVSPVMRAGIRGIKVDIISRDDLRLRTLSDVIRLIDQADITPNCAKKVISVFEAIARAEAKVHGCAPNEIHFHEIGAVDTLVDVTGVIEALSDLGIEGLVCSPLPVAKGWIECEHGRLPLPAPATLELLKGAPIYGVLRDGELVTPTGAALVTTLSDGFGKAPPMRIEGIGYGAGARDEKDIANVLRVVIGVEESFKESRVIEIKAHIDDMNPQWYEHIMERLFAEGALDVGISPFQMKKNRPGAALTVIAPVGKEDVLSRIVFEESTTTGLRLTICERYTIPRQTGVLKTKLGMVAAKMILKPGGNVIAPEYESCRKMAKRLQIPLAMVYEAVARATLDDFTPFGETDDPPGRSFDGDERKDMAR
ncbi:MAG: nickel pincer cofactor biosynthesis protein LarC [Dissulfurimicrobium sp.]|uniref:nickel pincer cofactor biosynthesis protein LarC n=1 Tax=Dissulfurimicrobium sp. TaxID=2022436 RepID=UPI0040493AFE